MKEPITIEGRWHIHGEDQPAHYGQLICDPVKGLRLEVKELRSDNLAAVLGRRQPQSRAVTAVQGFSAGSVPVRLFGSFVVGENGQTGLRTHRLFVQRAVTPLAGGVWSELHSQSFQLRFSMLQSWMDRRISVKDDTIRPGDIRISVRPGLTVTLGAIIRSHTSRSRFEVSHDSWLGLEFADDQPVWRVHSEDTLALALFLSLLIGDAVALDDFNFLQPGATDAGPDVIEHRLLERRGYAPAAKDEKNHWLMRATYPEVQDGLAEMLRRWFAMFESPDMRAVLDLYSAVIFSDLYDTAKFLILAQALEAYHTACGRFSGAAMPEVDFAELKKRVKSKLSKEDYQVLAEKFVFANQKTYRTKLEEVVAAAPAQARHLINDVPSFANVVKDLRNAYTHHVGDKAQKTRSKHDRSVLQLTRQAQSLLEMLLLSEMGAPEAALDKIVREHNSAVCVDFREPTGPPSDSPLPG